jgi:hypothetical protein
MKIKTSELSGVALDWAVAQVVDRKLDTHQAKIGLYVDNWDANVNSKFVQWSPSTDWSQGGPLIERFCSRMATNGDRSGPDPDTGNHYEDPHVWSSCVGLGSHGRVGYGQGRTALIAACRAIVAAKLGDEVDVPEGLV